MQNIIPNRVYSEIFPKCTDFEKIAWLFCSNYKSDSKTDSYLKKRIRIEIQKWMDMWKHGRTNIPTLSISRKDTDYYLNDSRFGHLEIDRITPSQAKVALFGFDNADNKDRTWGTAKKVVYYYEGEYLPLATTIPEIYNELKHEH